MKKIDYEDIVTNFSQPILVLAGPGAGKTYLLGDRVKRLIEKGVNPKTITILTFARDANQHMRNKLMDTIDGFGIAFKDLPNVSTMHSLGFTILNEDPGYFGFRKNPLVQENEKVKQLLFRDAGYILKLSEVDSEEAFHCKTQGNCDPNNKNKICNICEKYWQIMSQCNRVDFDDQIIFAYKLLESNSSLLKKYQALCKYLLVDEYQDINMAQFKLIELLSRRSREGLFVVGDDAQSIYGFRGANPKLIQGFKDDFENAITIPLIESRRCHENIMKDASTILKHYYPTWSGPFDLNYHNKPGDQPQIYKVPSEIAEADLVAIITAKAFANKESVLILVPKKEFLKLISKSLKKYSIPHFGANSFLPIDVNNRIEILKDLIFFLEESEDNFKTRIALEVLLNHGKAKVPGAIKSRKLTPKTLERRVSAEQEIAKLWEYVSKKNNLLTILQKITFQNSDIEFLKKTINTLVDFYINATGKEPGEFAKLLTTSIGIWIDPLNFVEDLSYCLSSLKSNLISGFEVVQMMTMRKAKGLESDVVIIVGLEDDIFPYDYLNMEEDARLFYVSMTRAKKRLYLLHSIRRPRDISHGDDLINKKRSSFINILGRPSIYKG
jgi:DNA helicase-2/ATP-dependent DNA helicase PcrA